MVFLLSSWECFKNSTVLFLKYMQPITQIILLQLFLVRYFKYLLRKGTSEVAVILLLLLSMVIIPPAEVSSFSIHCEPSLKKLLKIGSTHDSTVLQGGVQSRVNFRTCFIFFCPLLHKFFHRCSGSNGSRKAHFQM